MASDLICRLRGHTPRKAYASDLLSLSITHTYSDGIGREHTEVRATCDRCGEVYRVGKMLLPPTIGDLKPAADRLCKLEEKVEARTAILEDALSRLEELEEVAQRTDGTWYWRASGDPVGCPQ